MTEMSHFAETIIRQKYAQQREDGTWETWGDIAHRVAKDVMANTFPELQDEVEQLIRERKFLPGGRTLYAAGRPFKAFANCLAGDTGVITSEGVRALSELVDVPAKIMDGRGGWIELSARSFGEQSVDQITFTRNGHEQVIKATPDHRWELADGSVVSTADLTVGDRLGQGVREWCGANPSVEGIRAGIVYGNGSKSGRISSRANLCGEKIDDLLGYFDGEGSVHANGVVCVGRLPISYKELPALDSDLDYLAGWLAGYIATDGCVSEDGRVMLNSADRGDLEHVEIVAALLGIRTFPIAFQMRKGYGEEETPLFRVMFDGLTIPDELILREKHLARFGARRARGIRKPAAWRVADVQRGVGVEEVFCYRVPTTERFVLQGDILTLNCYLLRAEDSREGWAKLMHDATSALMSGGGIGVNYSSIRPRGATVGGLGGICTGPIALMEAVNETARQIQAGGSRRAAVYASLHWWHPDVFEFIKLKDWDERTKEAKAEDFNARAPMDMTNISVALDDAFFEIMDDVRSEAKYTIGRETYTVDRAWAEKMYAAAVKGMLETGEPGFQVDLGDDSEDILRNACCEIVSSDHFDMCNLGSLNMGAFEDIEEWKRAVWVGTYFLLAVSVVGDTPNEEAQKVRHKNRRLGLGLMGLYDWLVAKGLPYGPSEALGEWLEEYEYLSDSAAETAAVALGVNTPVAVRSVAPAGTISIVAECSSGIEPLFATAYKRRYLKGDTWHFQYVVDAGARRLQEKFGIEPDKLETAYDLAYDPERRIAMQAFVQEYVDNAISSTLNLPSVEEHALDPNKFAAMLYSHLPGIRGITAYPDGARGGQPLTVVPYSEASSLEGVEYEEFSNEHGCVGGVCGI